MKTETQMRSAQLQLAGGDATATAAILAHLDAQQSQQQARASRRAHQQDQVAQLKKAASKLKEMAGNALYSGLYQGVMGLGSAVYEGKNNSAISKLFEAAAKIDPASIKKEQLAADRAENDAQAAKESSLAQEAGDSVSTQQRLQSSMAQQLQKILEGQNAAGRAAVKL